MKTAVNASECLIIKKVSENSCECLVVRIWIERFCWILRCLFLFFFFSYQIYCSWNKYHYSYTVLVLFTYYLLDWQLFYKKNIKNKSYNTIHIFKNYFATVFLIFSFSNNKIGETHYSKNARTETKEQENTLHKLHQFLQIFACFENEQWYLDFTNPLFQIHFPTDSLSHSLSHLNIISSFIVYFF